MGTCESPSFFFPFFFTNAAILFKRLPLLSPFSLKLSNGLEELLPPPTGEALFSSFLLPLLFLPGHARERDWEGRPWSRLFFF